MGFDVCRNLVTVVRLVGASNAFKHVLLMAFLINVIAAAVENENVCDVATKSKTCNHKHELTIDVSRVEQSVDGLDQKPNQEAPNYNNTSEGANYICTMVAVRILQSCRFARQVNSQERNHEPGHITQLMCGVTQDS